MLLGFCKNTVTFQSAVKICVSKKEETEYFKNLHNGVIKSRRMRKVGHKVGYV